MPTPLLDRCRPHSVAEFRAAALQRYADGLLLAAAGRRTAAIYLWGYVAEMLLKAGVFALLDGATAKTIPLKDITDAKLLAADLGFKWAGNAHNLVGWAELLVRLRSDLPGGAYPNPAFGAGVIARAARVYGLWRETLRYHKNVASAAEAHVVRAAVEWLVATRNRL
ncbi:MAG TPA: hypothetical protein VD866_29705 [Urbifossiella sp.]|nr:hypothetical protein [Urbifossiella sp.]